MSSKPQSSTTDNKEETRPAANQGFSLEEDDEFEDFPVEDWQDAETEVPSGKANLWEESWDDNDRSEDFSAQLREELKKVEGK
ncbi:DSS1/SEM1 family-domain-containing protein [Kalaharituber pfeilii]|nr:DSS1/SEM1 family-domain-containing protein [Kalaharituber pfeilii]